MPIPPRFVLVFDNRGHNIGVRLIEEFLARGNVPDLAQRKRDPKELAEIVAKKGFRMFLGVEAKVTSWANNNTECSFILDENPLLEFVELPDEYAGLQYANIICGALRGALEQVRSSSLSFPRVLGFIFFLFCFFFFSSISKM